MSENDETGAGRANTVEFDPDWEVADEDEVLETVAERTDISPPEPPVGDTQDDQYPAELGGGDDIDPCSLREAAQNWNSKIGDYGYAHLCLRLTREIRELPPVGYSAKTFADSVPSRHRHYSPLDRIPRGAWILYRNLSSFGHITTATGRFCISNDYVTTGRVDRVPRSLPAWGGANYYSFWTDWTPFGMLPMTREWDGRVPDLANVQDHGPRALWRVQARLYDLGFRDSEPVRPDDDPKYPRQAIMRFQRKHGMRVDGEYGRKTHSILF